MDGNKDGTDDVGGRARPQLTYALIAACAEVLFLAGLVVSERRLAVALSGTAVADAPWKYALILAAAGLLGYLAVMVPLCRSRLCGSPLGLASADRQAPVTSVLAYLAGRVAPAAEMLLVVLLPYAVVGPPYWPVFTLPAFLAWRFVDFLELRRRRQAAPGQINLEENHLPSLAAQLDGLRQLARRRGIERMHLCFVKADGSADGPQAACNSLRAAPSIYLTEQLARTLSRRELRAVFAHELAHHELRHSQKGLVAAALVNLAALAVVCSVLLGVRPGGGGWWPALRLAPAILLLWYASRLVLSPLARAYCRFQELQADRRALEITNDCDAFSSAYRKLAGCEAANARPSRLAGWLFAAAPSLAERLAVAQAHAQHQADAEVPASDSAKGASR